MQSHDFRMTGMERKNSHNGLEWIKKEWELDGLGSSVEVEGSIAVYE